MSKPQTPKIPMSKVQQPAYMDSRDILAEGIQIELPIQFENRHPQTVDDKIIELAKRISMLSSSLAASKKFLQERMEHANDMEKELKKTLDELKSRIKDISN